MAAWSLDPLPYGRTVPAGLTVGTSVNRHFRGNKGGRETLPICNGLRLSPPWRLLTGRTGHLMYAESYRLGDTSRVDADSSGKRGLSTRLGSVGAIVGGTCDPLAWMH